jgi:hypothetical protein
LKGAQRAQLVCGLKGHGVWRGGACRLEEKQKGKYVGTKYAHAGQGAAADREKTRSKHRRVYFPVGLLCAALASTPSATIPVFGFYGGFLTDF